MRARWTGYGLLLLLTLVAFPARGQDAAGPAVPPSGPPAAQDAIFWYPAPSRCTYFTAEQKAAFRFDDPNTWRFAFLVMVETTGPEPAERGYVMVDGVLRELEKVRSGADGNQASVTVWRSAGEPRVNVNMTMTETGRQYEEISYAGRMTVIRGGGRTETEIVGTCGG